MTTTVSRFKMPKGGIIGKDGKPTKAGHHYLAGIDKATEPRAGTAEQTLRPNQSVVQTSGLWQTMATDVSSGAVLFRPDLGRRLDFVFTLTGAVQMLYPDNVPSGAWPFFSVEFRQDGVGGRPLTFDALLAGEPPEILDEANDATLCGFKVRENGTWTGWVVKGIPASL